MNFLANFQYFQLHSQSKMIIRLDLAKVLEKFEISDNPIIVIMK